MYQLRYLVCIWLVVQGQLMVAQDQFGQGNIGAGSAPIASQTPQPGDEVRPLVAPDPQLYRLMCPLRRRTQQLQMRHCLDADAGFHAVDSGSYTDRTSSFCCTTRKHNACAGGSICCACRAAFR